MPRKLIEFDPETLQALEFLGRDSMRDMQELAEEAFRDLFMKHGRPTVLKGDLRKSARAGQDAGSQRSLGRRARGAR